MGELNTVNPLKFQLSSPWQTAIMEVAAFGPWRQDTLSPLPFKAGSWWKKHFSVELMQSPATTSGISNCYCFMTITSLDVSWHPAWHYSVAQQRSIRCHQTPESQRPASMAASPPLCSNDRNAGA